MRVRPVSFADLDVTSTVAQMDSVVSQLRAAWQKLWDANTPVWFVSADAINNRALAVKSLIDDLDAGGVGREHVFFPLPGQTQADAWQAWQDTAEWIRNELNGIGASIGKWTFTSVAATVGGAVGDEFTKTGKLLLWGVGALVVLQGLSLVGNAKRAFSGRRQRR